MKMTRFAKLFFWFLAAVLLLWQLPWAIGYLTAKPANTPFTLYSEVLGDFVMIRYQDKEAEYLDRRGMSYSRREFDSLLPLFYARQLVADNRFPDSVAGRPVTLHEVQQAAFIFRSTPKEVNAPSSGIHFLLESMSGRVDLTMPSDAFRLTERGIEFIDMASNRIDSAKSARFTATMLRKGVRFPVREIAGNPTARKEYDEGYVLLDADGRLFHLKMVQERPYVRAVELPEGVRLRHLFITEFRSRRMLALMTDERNRLHALLMPGYRVRPVEGVAFDPARESMTIIGTLLNWTLCVADDDTERYYAVSADDLSLLDTMRRTVPWRHIPGLSFTSPADRYVRPRLR